MGKFSVYTEQRFRTPHSTERAVGLWVDRIGSSTDNRYLRDSTEFRKLGQYAVVRVDKGSGLFETPTIGRRKVFPDQVMVLFPDEPHWYGSTEGWTTRWIVWNGPDAATFEQLGFLIRETPILADPVGSVTRAFDRSARIIDSEDLAAVLERKNIVSEMVLDLFRGAPRTVYHRRREDLMVRVVEYLTEHFTDPIEVSRLSRQFNLSPPHLRRLFKQYTGRSPRDFLISLRVSRAKELLALGKAIKEVAPAVGYDDIFYFMRIFRKTVGIPPRTFVNRFQP